MNDCAKILSAYNRARARHLASTGVSYPAVREACVLDDGTIVDTQMWDPQTVATWRETASGAVKIELA